MIAGILIRRAARDGRGSVLWMLRSFLPFELDSSLTVTATFYIFTTRAFRFFWSIAPAACYLP